MEYCKGCNHLNVTEAEQDALWEKEKEHTAPHYCNKHKRRLYHLDAHPEIIRCKECTEPLSQQGGSVI